MKTNPLRLKRLTLKISQREMARRLGVDRRTIIRWETGKTPLPRLATLAIDNMRA